MKKFSATSLFKKNELIPVIVQDDDTNEVLMLAYMNKKAFKRTIKTKKLHFYSRSRNKIWLKGETSGHFQYLRSMYIDCDNDTLLVRVIQKGGACHDGYKSCFYRKLVKGQAQIISKKIFQPEKVYGEIRK